MATSWHLAPSLAQLRREINARWPNRDKSTDGSVGDLSHAARASDHNPNSRRSVNAIDIDEDGIDAWGLVDLAITDPRVNYVIYERKIWQRKHGFKPRPYSGINAHTKHIHVSIIQSVAAEQNTAPWGIAKIGASSGIKPSTGGTTTKPSTTNPKPNTESEEDIMAGISKDDLTAIIRAEVKAALIGVLEDSKRYTEYVDEDGKGRNTRSIVDVIYAGHGAAVGANRTAAKIAKKVGA